MNNPNVISALIAAIVSLIVAGVSGLYVLYQSNRRLKSLRDELVTTNKTERFIKACEEFRKAYRVFEKQVAEVNFRNPEDGTELIQLYIDFYAAYARDLYLENQELLGAEELNKGIENISRLVESGVLNEHTHPDRTASLIALFASLRDFSTSLFERSLKY